MDTLETRMRAVLLQLELTSNGRTVSFDPSGGGEPNQVPTLGPGDAPHLYWAQRWDDAGTEHEQRDALKGATANLKDIRRSSGDRTRVESRADRDKRIVAQGEGIAARDIANWARCGVRDVHNARRAADRDPELGHLVRNGHDLRAPERADEIKRLAGGGMPARQIAFALTLSYSTVLRALGRKDPARRT